MSDVAKGSDQNSGIEVYEVRTFEKAYKKLSSKEQTIVDDEIEKIIVNPEIGERKKGDLSYLWVHKFRMSNQLTLLGYSWDDNELVIHLLSIGSHENFYTDEKNLRKSH